MSIEATYRDILIKAYIQQQLDSGNVINAVDLQVQVETLMATLDLSVPQFEATDYHVEENESSSAAKHNTTFNTILQDVTALYKEMLGLSEVSSSTFSRWGLEAENIEKKLVDLEDRIEDILLLTQDTEGYHSVLIDNFTDMRSVDTDLTDVNVSLEESIVSLGTTATTGNRLFLNDLDPTTDVSFKVRSTADFKNRTDAIGTNLINPFLQQSSTWWTSIGMGKQKPLTCELLVKLGEDPITISKIFMQLHESSESSPTNITPLYSIDNNTFHQLPTTNYTQEVRTQATFQFSEVDAKWIKFILTKEGSDPSAGSNFFYYEFGFKQISFFIDSFTIDTTQTLVTEPLWVLGTDGLVKEFEKLTLDACERLETDTTLKYFITTAATYADIETNFDYDTALWTPISPVSRTSPLHPIILDVGDITEVLIGDTETLKIAYNGTASITSLINPSDPFQLLSKNSTTEAVIDEEVHEAGYLTTPIVRYAFKNTNDRILNYQVKDSDYSGSGTGDALVLNEQSLLLFRNVGEQGLTPGATSALVRSIERGWRFKDPYYTCVIEIRNAEGISMNVGDSPMIIDDVSYTNEVTQTVLTGKTTSNSGLHTIKVHKSNWKTVTPDATTQTSLKLLDPLYPYNHKMLIEGYAYHSSYTETEIYTGVDLFAETVMKQVSIFDLLDNILPDNYDVFALDRDVPNSHVSGNEPTRVFVLKIDENNPDFQNERYVLKFTMINQLQSYLRLRVDFATTDGKVTPALHSYKMKLG